VPLKNKTTLNKAKGYRNPITEGKELNRTQGKEQSFYKNMAQNNKLHKAKYFLQNYSLLIGHQATNSLCKKYAIFHL
jgi:hypothetical protein